MRGKFPISFTLEFFVKSHDSSVLTQEERVTMERIRVHIAMLDLLEKDVQKAWKGAHKELSRLRSKAVKVLKRYEKKLSSPSGRSIPLDRWLDKAAGRQKKLAALSPRSSFSFLRAYRRYLKSLIALQKSAGKSKKKTPSDRHA